MQWTSKLKWTAVAVLWFVVTNETVQGAWRAGAASISITPAQPMWMSGYGSRDHVAEGKLTDLWAKALVLEDDKNNRAVLITLDLVGIDRTLSRSVCKNLAEKYGLHRNQIAICTSHTHTGPVVGRNLGPMHYLRLDQAQQSQIDAYTNSLEEKVISVVGQAIEKLAPAQLAQGNGIATFAVNRRNNAEAQVDALRNKGELRGPVDYDVPILSVRNVEGGLEAVVFGYACHATVLSSYQWSGDYPGFAQAAIEKSHPGCVAMFFAGCGADQNPLPRRTVDLAQAYGTRLAESVGEVLSGVMQPLASDLGMEYQEIALPLGTLPSREEVAADTQSDNPFIASRARMLLAQLETTGLLETSYPYPIQSWKLGNELRWVFLGGEVVVDYSRRIKHELGASNTWCAGYANDVMAYIPSRRVLMEGGYEGATSMIYYGLPTIWAPELEEKIVNEVLRQNQ